MEKKNIPETSDMSGVRAGSGTSDKRYNDVSYIKAVEATKERIAPAFNKGPLQLVGNPKDLKESNGK